MKPSAMPNDHQLLLVIMLRMPAAVVAAMAMAPQIASWRDGFWGRAVARMIMAAPARRPRVMSTCAARNVGSKKGTSSGAAAETAADGHARLSGLLPRVIYCLAGVCNCRNAG